MITLHVQNEIADFPAWKAAFDRYDRARRDHGVRAYRITQPAGNDSVVHIELDFDSREDAAGFVAVLEKIWQTPLSREVSSSHTVPELHEVREQLSLA